MPLELNSEQDDLRDRLSVKLLDFFSERQGHSGKVSPFEPSKPAENKSIGSRNHAYS